MKKAIISDQSFEIDDSLESIQINGKSVLLDIAQINETDFHVLKGDKSFQIQVLSVDRLSRSVKLKINNKSCEVDIKSDMDLLLEKLGMESKVGSGDKEVKAPMPGLIIDVLIVHGQEVKKGDQLLILEAMKMENVIKSPSDGIVNVLTVSKGDSVEKGKILLSL